MSVVRLLFKAVGSGAADLFMPVFVKFFICLFVSSRSVSGLMEVIELGISGSVSAEN